MNKDVVLDASALIALFKKEKGAEVIEKYLPRAIMSAVNFSEVISVLANAGIDEEEAKILTTDVLKEIIPLDIEQAYLVAKLRPITKKYGLSLGDRSCLALAQIKKTTVITADKIWNNLQLNGINIEVIR